MHYDAESLPPDPFDELLGYHLRRLSVLVMADLAATLAPFGLKPAEASVLFMIGQGGVKTQSDIGRALGIQRANMAPLIAGLIKRGLLVRERVDGRSQALTLSAAGFEICQKAWAATKAHEDRMFGTLSDPEREALLARVRGLWR
jgi:DNA-binding MarR family transcriptional regulator